MKKLLVAIILLSTILISSFSFAAVGSVTTTASTINVLGTKQRIILTLTWTAGTGGDAGTVPDTTLNPATYGIQGWYLYSVETDPGTTAPTDLYDITLIDANGLDIAGGKLADRSTTATELVNIGTASFGYPMILGNIIVKWANNSVSASTGVIIMAFTAN